MPWNSRAPPAIPAAVVAACRRNPELAPGAASGAIAGWLAIGAACPPPDCVQTGPEDGCGACGAGRPQGPAEGTLPCSRPPRKLVDCCGCCCGGCALFASAS